MKNFITFFLVLNSLLFSQWTKTEYGSLYGTIHELYLADSLNLTAVFCHYHKFYPDGNSAVIKSSDGGMTWSFSQKLPLDYIREAKIIDEETIFATSASTDVTTMKRTTDGGLTWMNLSLPSNYQMLKCIQFLDPNIAYAGANFLPESSGYGRLLKTTDGGISWAATDSIDRVIHGVKFHDKLHGWVLGNQILETTDGGRTFTQIPSPNGFENIVSFDILNDTTIAIGGYRIEFYPPNNTYLIIQLAFSTDRGQSWRFSDFGQEIAKGSPEKMIVLDENTAIAHMRYNKGFIYTTNQGMTWNWSNYPEHDYWYQDLKQFGNRLYLAGLGASLVVSGEDITQPWEIRLHGFFPSVLCAAFSESGLAVVGTNKSTINISSDKGSTWNRKPIQVIVPWSIFMVTDSLIYIANDNTIFRSVDQCNTIDTIVSIPNGWIRDFKIAPNGVFWICNREDLMASSDNGIIWETKLHASSQSFDQLILFEDGTYYADDSRPYKSTDYGETWIKLNMPFQYLRDLSFYNSKNGLVIDDMGNLHRTADGGRTYQQILIPGLASASRIYCNDPFNYYLAANKIYSSRDAGESWQINEFDPAVSAIDFGWIHMYNEFEVVGISSSTQGIWITKNRGNTPVELSTFSAIPLGNKVVLQWTTVTETNNMGFEIERKFKIGSWEKIATVKGNGTVTQKVHYSFDDLTLSGEGIYYYRLKQIDYNGAFEYSKEVEVIFGEVPEVYAIQQNYPNPFNPSTKINFLLPEENKVVIRVFNPMGELVQEINRGTLSHGHFEQDIDMGSNPSGMYFCQVLCTNTKTERIKSLTIKMVLMK
jgi:photosystem II stability/assembly factor-like uncharacterized protein